MGTWPAITTAAGMAAVAPQGMSQSRAKKRRKGSRENVREEEDGERREKKGKREGSMCRGPHETQSAPPPWGIHTLFIGYKYGIIFLMVLRIMMTIIIMMVKLY